MAGAWTDRKHLQEVMDELRSKNINVTSNWPSREDTLDIPTVYRDCSRFDIEEIKSADYVLAFMTLKDYAYRGTFTEIGCAIGANKKIIVVCDGTAEIVRDERSNCKN